jgi:uncharacterized protein YdeI (YjbR/CyaY-like superfamily)
MSADPRIDAYIAAREAFAQPILAWLRARVHAACPAVEESIKWGMPSFGYRGRPLAGMGAFKNHATFGFWDRGELATGREGQAMGQYGRITSLDDLPTAEEVEARVRAATALIDTGARAKRAKAPPKTDLPVPEALALALASDAAAAATFDAFPSRCRREYIEWIVDAKRQETRDKRVVQTVEWLREGKRRNWKYESC